MADTVEHTRPVEEKTADIGPRRESEVDSEKADSEYKQEGVQQVEAITSAWTVKALWITFVLLWIVEFSDSMLINTQYALEPYVTSSFSQHGLLATTNIMSSIIAGVSKLTIAKIIDIWGRVEGFALVLVLLLMGLVMKAACQNVTTYAAAAVFYWVGHTGLGYTIDVFTSDMTTLRNRAIIYGLNYTPTIATVFAGPAAAQDFLEHSSWRWGFGCFCIIMPIVCIPVFTSFTINHKKAKKLGLAPPRNSGRTWTQSAKHYLIEFDVLGMLLTTAAFSLILLPFSLASGSQDKWASGSIIAMLVIGVLCFVGFVVWEKYYAPIQYLPFHYLKDPTIGGSCLCSFTMFASIFCWDAYLGSFLQVVNQLNVRDSGYVVNSFSLTSAIFMPLTGLAIRYVGRPKWIAMTAVPIATIGTGLIIHFRQPDQRAGYITMTQILNGAASGILASTLPVAIMAAVSHQHIAVVLALQGLFMSIGSSVGLAIAGAIWTNLLPGALERHLPSDLKPEALNIYADLTVQLGYEFGTPARDGIIAAYGDIMRLQVIAGVCFMPLMFVSILIWKNYNVKTMVQTKGTVF